MRFPRHSVGGSEKSRLALKRAGFILADVQSDDLSLTRCIHITDFCINQQLSFVEDILRYASPCVNKALLQVAGVGSFPSQLFKSK